MERTSSVNQPTIGSRKGVNSNGLRKLPEAVLVSGSPRHEQTFQAAIKYRQIGLTDPISHFS